MEDAFIQLSVVGGRLQAERLCELLESAGLSVLIEHMGPKFNGSSSIQQFRLLVPHSQSQRAAALMSDGGAPRSETFQSPMVANF